MGRKAVSDAPDIKKQLDDAIVEPRVRVKVGLVIDLCLAAVANLDSLDHGIYQRSQAAGVKHSPELPGRPELEGLARDVLEGVRSLAFYLSNTDLVADEGETDDDLAMDFDFDLGGPAAPEEVSLDDFDIDSALDGLAPQSRRSSDERWAGLSAEMTSLSYAMSSQLADFDERFARTLDGERIVQALRELDDVGNALIDGVFALMSAICETYLSSFDRNQLLPGHRSTLSKALLVRRGLADLRRAVKTVNTHIQDAKAPVADRQDGVDTVALELAIFVDSEVFAVMRPADRLELQSFYEETADKTVAQAAMSCEGLDKYLDSLLSVNQRDVLIKHDRELMGEIAALLEGVGPIVDISPHGAMNLVREAFGIADALYGYHDALDDLLAEWQEAGSRTTEPAAMVAIGERLAALSRAAG